LGSFENLAAGVSLHAVILTWPTLSKPRPHTSRRSPQTFKAKVVFFTGRDFTAKTVIFGLEATG